MTNPEIKEFVLSELVPAATESLKKFYQAYCYGSDIGLTSKSDSTPASEADRQTEKTLRHLIEKRFPHDSIIGEEFEDKTGESSTTWVLDPLDGTREFLSRKPGHFGSLIGVFEKGRPLYGVIIDPLNDRAYESSTNFGVGSAHGYVDFPSITMACTNPEGMFSGTQYDPGMRVLISNIHCCLAGLNCIGFAKCASGEIDLVVERDLALHDIAALLPVLQANNCTVIDFNGTSYFDLEFDMRKSVKTKYDIITARNNKTAFKVLETIKG